MTDVELLIQEYNKRYVPYKVAVYVCGCSYIHIQDKEKRILKKHNFCPEHKRGKKYILLWCNACGVPIKAIPRAGYRQKWCASCAKVYIKHYNRMVWQERYGKKHKTIYVPKKATSKEKERAVNKGKYRRFLKGLDRRLPVVETPVLDRLTNG